MWARQDAKPTSLALPLNDHKAHNKSKNGEGDNHGAQESPKTVTIEGSQRWIPVVGGKAAASIFFLLALAD